MTGTRESTAKFLLGRHALVPFTYRTDLELVREYASPYVVDCGAYSAWTKGADVDFAAYQGWARGLKGDPNFDWAIIPDVIGGSEAENDAMLSDWDSSIPGVPVWHTNESVDRMIRLSESWPRVAIGAHPDAPPGSEAWWVPIRSALDAITGDDGRPITKLHGLRMLDPRIFTKLPLASADSVNVARNANNYNEVSPSRLVRMEIIASRIESQTAAQRWERHDQIDLWDTPLSTSRPL